MDDAERKAHLRRDHPIAWKVGGCGAVAVFVALVLSITFVSFVGAVWVALRVLGE